MNVILDHTEDIAENIKTFWFKPAKPVHYVAGQFTELYLPHDGADDRGTRRWFTLSSSPTEPLVSITTKFSDPGSSFKRTLAGLKPGTALALASPMGDFVLPKDASRPLVFVAGGMGITPMRSMIKYLLDCHEQRDIHLIYAVTKREELAFEPLFTAYGLKFTTVIKNPPQGYTGEAGSLSAERILQLAPKGENTL